MRLKSFGCSFIFGSDLHDDGSHDPVPTASQHTWPALLARHNGWPYECYARPGSGNLQIASSVLNQLEHSEPSVYVIGWTWIDRFDYADPVKPRWHTILPVSETDQAKFYYKNFHSQYQDKLTSLLYINSVLTWLRSINQPFIMTYMDHLLFETKWHCTPAVTLLQNSIKSSMILFENQTFLEWSKTHGHTISQFNHPLESAHQSAFELIKDINIV